MPAKKTLEKRHVQYHKDGSIWAKGKTVDGVPTGDWKWFRKDGTTLRSGRFENGEQVGEWITYDKTGKLYKVTTMKAKSRKQGGAAAEFEMTGASFRSGVNPPETFCSRPGSNLVELALFFPVQRFARKVSAALEIQGCKGPAGLFDFAAHFHHEGGRIPVRGGAWRCCFTPAALDQQPAEQ